MSFYVENHGQSLSYQKDGNIFTHLKLLHNFPASLPFGRAISVLDDNGKEIDWIENIFLLDNEQMVLLRNILLKSLPIIEIKAIYSIDSNLFPAVWEVNINDELKKINLEDLESIIILEFSKMIIKDRNGEFFLIRSIKDLDQKSKKLLSPFVFNF